MKRRKSFCFKFKVNFLCATAEIYSHRFTVWFTIIVAIASTSIVFLLFFLCFCGKKIMPQKTQIHCLVYNNSSHCYSLHCISSVLSVPLWQKIFSHTKLFYFLFVKICALVATKKAKHLCLAFT